MEQTAKIVGGLSEFKEEKKLQQGLINRLKNAKTEAEIDYLINLGKSYKKVSPGTLRKWVRIAYNRRNSFNS